MAFSEQPYVKPTAGASASWDLGKPVSAAIVLGAGSILYGFSSGDALRCAAAGGMSAMAGELAGNWLMPAEAGLKGMARSMMRQGADAAVTGAVFVYAKPMAGVARPFSIAGQSQRVSTFLAGAAGSVGGDFLYPTVKATGWW